MKTLLNSLIKSLPCCVVIFIFTAHTYGYEFKLADNENTPTRSVSSGGVATAPQEMLLAEPKYKSKPLYITLGKGDDIDSFITCSLDESGGPDTGYDTIYIDQNNNGDLTDDPAITCKKKDQGSQRHLTVNSFPVLVKYFDGTERNIKFRLKVRRNKSRNKVYWYVTCDTIQHLEGKVNINGKDILVGLYDLGARRSAPNASFNDLGADQIRIDKNGNGKLEDNEASPLCKIFSLDDKLWLFSSDATANEVSIIPCPLPAAKLTINFNMQGGATKPASYAAGINGDNGFVSRITLPTKTALVLPEGSYTIKTDNMPFTGSTGLVWKADISTPKPIKIKGGENLKLTFGNQLKMTPTFRSNSIKAGRKLRVEQTVFGASGEQYKDIRPGKGRRIAPYVKLLDKKKTILAEGKMEYG